MLASLAAAGSAAADPPSGTKPKAKASSFAPHHTKTHVYGTPVSKPILRKRQKRPHAAAAAAGADAPIK